MRRGFEHSRHLVRMALLFGAWIGAFLIVRAMLIPENFGEFGHYRPGAVPEVASRPSHFAGKTACLSCHDGVSQDNAKNKHAALSCEACHGALAKHVDEITEPVPRPAREDTLCLGCHRATTSKPAWFKQVDPVEHFAGSLCMECHQPHAP